MDAATSAAATRPNVPCGSCRFGATTGIFCYNEGWAKLYGTTAPQGTVKTPHFYSGCMKLADCAKWLPPNTF